MKAEDADPPEFHLTLLNTQIREMMNTVLRRHGIKLVEWRLLQCLDSQGALSVCDLAALAVIERTATSRLIDRMVDKGFVCKEQMPDDRRFARISLAPDGREKLRSCAEDVDGARARLFEGLRQDDIGALLETLKRLQQNAVGVLLECNRAPAPIRRIA